MAAPANHRMAGARALMLQGTGSSVGKSLLVAGLARVCHRRGIAVRPFKPQNMSNNAAVTPDGGEIGRAQALQALAAGVLPSLHMNPVLLKPQTETGAQVIVQGRITGNLTARDYQQHKAALLPAVLESFAKLKAESEIVLVEGAGSASEINLRAHDIANMGFARAADVPVVLVGDIDRGGVIGSLVGTKTVLETSDAELIQGFIVNRMRGDPSLFADGLTAIARITGWPALGLVPFFEGAHRLPAEDALDLTEPARQNRHAGRVRIAVLHLPRIANFDDLDPLVAEPDIELLMVRPGEPLPAPCELVILPGSKATLADLHTLRRTGWDVDLLAHVRRGGRVLGLCGGYQILGRRLADPEGIEGPSGESPGLGLLDIETVLTAEKRLDRVSGTTLENGLPFQGYEMHVGQTTGPDTERPVLRFDDGRLDGATSKDGLIAGTYVHGLFTDDRQRAAWLKRIGGKPSGQNYAHEVEATLDALANHLESHIAIDRLLSLAR